MTAGSVPEGHERLREAILLKLKIGPSLTTKFVSNLFTGSCLAWPFLVTFRDRTNADRAVRARRLERRCHEAGSHREGENILVKSICSVLSSLLDYELAQRFKAPDSFRPNKANKARSLTKSDEPQVMPSPG